MLSFAEGLPFSQRVTGGSTYCRTSEGRCPLDAKEVLYSGSSEDPLRKGPLQNGCKLSRPSDILLGCLLLEVKNIIHHGKSVLCREVALLGGSKKRTNG